MTELTVDNTELVDVRVWVHTSGRDYVVMGNKIEKSSGHGFPLDTFEVVEERSQGERVIRITRHVAEKYGWL